MLPLSSTRITDAPLKVFISAAVHAYVSVVILPDHFTHAFVPASTLEEYGSVRAITYLRSLSCVALTGVSFVMWCWASRIVPNLAA